MYKKIITHNDFDGIVCAALCSHYYKIDDIIFASPNNIIDKSIIVNNDCVLCDLPYSTNCGLWFDHHIGNKEELNQRKINIDEIPGCFCVKPSCARVVYDYLGDKAQWPHFFSQTVIETDIIDSFAYSCAQDWIKKTPGKLINCALNSGFSSPQEEFSFMRSLVSQIKSASLEEITALDWIKPRVEKYYAEESAMINIIKESTFFISNDRNREIAVIDLTKFNRKPNIIRALVFLLYPESKAVISIQNQFNRGIKLNNLFISMSLGFYYYNKKHGKDIGMIMDTLGLGDGHTGAAGGRIYCNSKQDMIRKKQDILKQIFDMWISQPDQIPE